MTRFHESQPDPKGSSQVTALVTGASRGIRRAIATELARTHQAIGTYRRRRDAAASLRADTGAEL